MLERPAAKERKAKSGGRRKIGEGNLPSPNKGKTIDKVGPAVGMSGKTYEKAKAVVAKLAREPKETGDVGWARSCAISGDHGWALHEPLQERRPATDGNGESASLSLRRVALFGMTRPDATPKPAEAAAGTATVAELRA